MIAFLMYLKADWSINDLIVVQLSRSISDVLLRRIDPRGCRYSKVSRLRLQYFGEDLAYLSSLSLILISS
jgi:hypothetical protein